MAIHVISDNEHDLHVLHLSGEPVARTADRGGCLIDLDAGGRAVALEILDRRGCNLEALADEFGFVDQLAEALDALTAAGVQMGAASQPSAVVATGGTATPWSQTEVVTGTAQIPAQTQTIDLILA